ncbi:MAG: ankyrin repeat domain-containing protein [Candidatus Acidiferrales bacterium]
MDTKVLSRMNLLNSIRSLPAQRYLRSLFLLLLGVPALAFGQLSNSSQETCQGPLFRAIYQGDTAEIEKLIDKGTNLNFRACMGNRTPLTETIVRGFDKTPAKMILAVADPNFAPDGMMPLIMASWYCRKDLVLLLLEKGAAVNGVDEEGNTALRLWTAKNCQVSTRAGIWFGTRRSVVQTSYCACRCD